MQQCSELAQWGILASGYGASKKGKGQKTSQNINRDDSHSICLLEHRIDSVIQQVVIALKEIKQLIVLHYVCFDERSQVLVMRLDIHSDIFSKVPLS